MSTPTIAQAPPQDAASIGSNAPAPAGAATVARRPGLAAVVEWVLILAAYVIQYFGPHWIGADGAHRFDALSRLLSRGDLHGPVEDTRYSLVGPLFSSPLWYLGRAFSHDPRAACEYYNWALFGVFLAVFGYLLKGVLAPSTVRRVLLLLVAGSMFPNHVQAYYAEVFTATFVAAGVLWVCTRRVTWPGWVAIVLGSVNTPGVALGAAALCAYFVVDRRLLRYVAPAVAMGALFLLEGWLRRSGKTGYEGVGQNHTIMPYSGRPGFSYPLFLGLLSLGFSFGKGIAFYAPGVFAPVARVLQGKPQALHAYRAWLCFLAGIVLLYAKFCGWYGGEFWGPRYMLFASVPASFALAVNLEENRSLGRSAAMLAMLTLSIWIGADGMVFGQAEMGQCWANGYALEHLCWYVPEFAAWIRPFVAPRTMETKDWLFLAVYATIYVYLAAPIVAFLVRSLATRSQPYFRRLADFRAWRV
jgi:hypothetical protein